MKRTDIYVIPEHEAPVLVKSLSRLARVFRWCDAHRGVCACVWATIGAGPTVKSELYLNTRNADTHRGICDWLRGHGHDCEWMLIHQSAGFLIWWSAISVARGGRPIDGVTASWQEYDEAKESGRCVAFAGLDVTRSWICQAPDLPDSRWFQPESRLEGLLLFGDPTTRPLPRANGPSGAALIEDSP